MGVNEGRPTRPPPTDRSPRGPARRYIWGIDGRGAGLSQPKTPPEQGRQEKLSNAINRARPKGLGQRTKHYRAGLR